MTTLDTKSNHSELQRLLRVSDQMVSQHAYLRDVYGRRALALDLCLVVLAGTLSAFTFATDSAWNVGFEMPISSKLFLAAGSTLVFVLSLVEWKVAWKVRKATHADAVKAYGPFKLKLRGLLKQHDNLPEQNVSELQQEYAAIGKFNEPIPERYFLKSKQHHKRKLAISKYLDDHPHATLWFVRLRFIAIDNRHAAGPSLSSTNSREIDEN